MTRTSSRERMSGKTFVYIEGEMVECPFDLPKTHCTDGMCGESVGGRRPPEAYLEWKEQKRKEILEKRRSMVGTPDPSSPGCDGSTPSSATN